MKKGDGPNPGVEFFYKLSLRREFQQDLIRARKQLGISEKGYSDPKIREKLWIGHKKADLLGLLDEEMQLKEKYKVPTPYFEFIDDYIFFGKPANALKKQSPVAMLSPTKELEEFYDAMYEPTAKLLLFGNATQEKVLTFIKKNWREIELTLNKNIHGAERVRRTIFKERNQAIRELYRKPVQELRKEAGVDLKYKDSLIAKILEKKYGAVSEGYIRKICSQK